MCEQYFFILTRTHDLNEHFDKNVLHLVGPPTTVVKIYRLLTRVVKKDKQEFTNISSVLPGGQNMIYSIYNICHIR